MAAGDITLTAAVTTSVPGFTVARLDINLSGALMNIQFLDALGGVHQATLTVTACVGFGISGGVISDGLARVISGEYTKLLGILFGTATGNANARRTAAIQ